MPLDTVYIVCSAKTGVPLSVFTTKEAAELSIGSRTDKEYVEPWCVRDGFTVATLSQVNRRV